MTREEAIDIIKCLAWHGRPDEEGVEQAIKTLEQESVVDRDCEHCSKTYGTFGCCDIVSNKWVYSCKEGQREYIFGKIKAEIEDLPKTYPFVNHFDMYVKVSDVTKIIDKYKAGSEVEE